MFRNLSFFLVFSNCLMSDDQANNLEAEKLYLEALKVDPSNETVLTMFAIFKCNRFVIFHYFHNN